MNDNRRPLKPTWVQDHPDPAYVLRLRGLDGDNANRFISAPEPLETEPLEVVRVFDSEKQLSVTLLGPTGVGKTVALAWAVATPPPKRWSNDDFDSIVEHEVGARYYTAIRLFRLFRAIEFGRADTRQQWAHRILLKAEVLAIDDLGREPMDEKGWQQSAFFELIDERINLGLPTILSANVSPSDVQSRYGPALVDRLYNGGKWAVLKNEKSLRGGAQWVRK